MAGHVRKYDIWQYVFLFYDTIEMGLCKKDVTPLLTHWSYIFLALTYWYDNTLYLDVWGFDGIVAAIFVKL